MRRGREIRNGLAYGLFAMLLLPVMLAIVLGLGGLLSALGDAPGAAFCLRTGLVIAVLWVTSIVATVAGTAVVQMSRGSGTVPRHRRRRRNERRLRTFAGRPSHGPVMPQTESEPRDRSV